MKNKTWIFIALAVAVFAGIIYFAFSAFTPTGKSVSENSQTISIKVAIPCSGHAQLIINELSKIDGVDNVDFSPQNNFKVYYTPAKTTKERILSAEIFKQYPARMMN